MKIAIAVANNLVTEHFGHCEYFVVYEVQDKKIVGSEIVKNPPHQKGYLPYFLQDLGIDCIITGNMGEMAVQALEGLNIQVYRGVSGDATEAIEALINGTLASSDVICTEHQHHHAD